MKYLVVSDTHGEIRKVVDLYGQREDIDGIIHLGDCLADAKKIEKLLSVDVIAVKGNMDGSSSPSDFIILNTEAGRIFLSHGHMENVKIQFQTIYYKALENRCICALFGHTHKAFHREIDGFHLANPGSLSLPADGTKGTYIILETSDAGLSFEIKEYSESGEDIARSQSKSSTHAKKSSKVQGGYLRSLLNYSDRF